MSDSNKNKTELLGEPYGTASNRLRKSILFKFIKETSNDICYRCGKKIENINNLSIEHKESWMRAKDPIKSFYNLSNVAFSHVRCNSSYGYRATLNIKNQGEKHGNSKLKENDVLDIRKEIKDGTKQTILAKKYNVTKGTIYDIKERRSWKHLE